ncbi:MAG: 2-hydroxyacyl-CoA dehydratase family protein, partial [Acutalibacteraceae bacterium]|nr:2-hydroxyacyl-CoA dehydratase family protein [Acutalibacteraceae bacterium]
LILPKLKETLEDLKTRKPDPKPGYRIKVVVAGSENDDPYFIQLIEECGARVVADRYCYGSIPGREEIEIKEGETALEAVARHYLQTSMCTRFMEQHVMRQRKETLAGIVKEYKADGIIIEQMKFCEYWSYERMIDTFVLRRDYGIPVCSIEKEYNNGATGQLRTRFQAFIESVELKKLQSEKAERGVG